MLRLGGARARYSRSNSIGSKLLNVTHLHPNTQRHSTNVKTPALQHERYDTIVTATRPRKLPKHEFYTRAIPTGATHKLYTRALQHELQARALNPTSHKSASQERYHTSITQKCHTRTLRTYTTDERYPRP